MAGHPDEVRQQRQQKKTGEEDGPAWDGASLLFVEGGASEDAVHDTGV